MTIEEVLQELKFESFTELSKKAVSVEKAGEWGCLPRGVRRTRSVKYKFEDGRVLVGSARNEMGYITALSYCWE
jgi:hypothetical protein